MTIASDIVVLEHGFKVDTLVLNGGAVLLKDSINLSFVLATSKVLSAGEESIS